MIKVPMDVDDLSLYRPDGASNKLLMILNPKSMPKSFIDYI